LGDSKYNTLAFNPEELVIDELADVKAGIGKYPFLVKIDRKSNQYKPGDMRNKPVHRHVAVFRPLQKAPDRETCFCKGQARRVLRFTFRMPFFLSA
jgi:hypothetical protein